MVEINKKALEEFLGEAQEILDGLNNDLLVMDEGSKQGKIDPDIMNNIFRGVHSLKGLEVSQGSLLLYWDGLFSSLYDEACLQPNSYPFHFLRKVLL